VDKIIPYDSKGKEGSLSGLINFAIGLRKYQFDLVVDLHGNFRSRVISSLCQSKIVLRYNNRRLDRLMLVYLKRRLAYKHTVELYIDTLKPLENLYLVPRIPNPVSCIPYLDNDATFYISDKADKWAIDFLKNYNVNDDDILIGLNPSATRLTKRWFPEKFSELGSLILKKYNSKIFTFGSTFDRKLTDEIAQNIGTNAFSIAGDIPLPYLPAVIKKCKAFITNDSGLMHISAFTGTKTIAIFGGTTTDLGFAPYGNGNIVISNENLKCRPCSLHGLNHCPKKHFKCLTEISVERVLKSLDEVI
jgi:heptosyltransferase-2